MTRPAASAKHTAERSRQEARKTKANSRNDVSCSRVKAAQQSTRARSELPELELVGLVRTGWVDVELRWCMTKASARTEAIQRAQEIRIPIQPSNALFLLSAVNSTFYFEMPSIGELAVA